jgi:hypothetical protein
LLEHIEYLEERLRRLGQSRQDRGGAAKPDERDTGAAYRKAERP